MYIILLENILLIYLFTVYKQKNYVSLCTIMEIERMSSSDKISQYIVIVNKIIFIGAIKIIICAIW